MSRDAFESDVNLSPEEESEILAECEAQGFPAPWGPENVSVSGPMVVIVPPDSVQGWAWTPEEARALGVALIEAAGVLESIEGGAVVWADSQESGDGEAVQD